MSPDQPTDPTVVPAAPVADPVPVAPAPEVSAPEPAPAPAEAAPVPETPAVAPAPVPETPVVPEVPAVSKPREKPKTAAKLAKEAEGEEAKAQEHMAEAVKDLTPVQEVKASTDPKIDGSGIGVQTNPAPAAQIDANGNAVDPNAPAAK